MTPELLALIGSLLDRYGLPISLLIGLGWLLLTRRLVLGSELMYVEERRKEEREGRLLAEAAIRELSSKSSAAIEAMSDSVDTIVSAVSKVPRARG